MNVLENDVFTLSQSTDNPVQYNDFINKVNVYIQASNF